MGGSKWNIFWKVVGAVVQHAAERELFVAGEIAAANGPNVHQDGKVRFGSKADMKP
jgi:hypothetical protein